ncbi:MAG: hypothetical protein GF364_11615 [Candidatus Lokiarchaeota archaeon]|nr:hypothetical protein [Candidatus Lokiarchaeota archaeon]
MVKNGNNNKNEEEQDEIFEDMYERQVSEFFNQHKQLFDEENNVFEMAKSMEKEY